MPSTVCSSNKKQHHSATGNSKNELQSSHLNPSAAPSGASLYSNNNKDDLEQRNSVTPNILGGSSSNKCSDGTGVRERTIPDATSVSFPSVTLTTFQHTIFGNLTLLPVLTAECSSQDNLSGEQSYLDLVLLQMKEYGRAGSAMNEWQLCKPSGYNMSQGAQTALLTKYSAICESHMLLNSDEWALTAQRINSLLSLLADPELDTVQEDNACTELKHKLTWRHRLRVTHNSLLQLNALIKESLQPASEDHVHLQLVNKLTPKTPAQVLPGPTQPLAPMPLCQSQDESDLTSSSLRADQKVKGILLRHHSSQTILLNFRVESVGKSLRGRTEFCIWDSRWSSIGDKRWKQVTLEEAYQWDITRQFETAHQMVKAFEISLRWLEPKMCLLTRGVDQDRFTRQKACVSTEITLVHGAVGFYRDTLQELLDALSHVSCNYHSISTQAQQIWNQKGVDFERYQHDRLIELLTYSAELSRTDLLVRISRVLLRITSDPAALARYKEIERTNRTMLNRLQNKRDKCVCSFGSHSLSSWKKLGKKLGFAVRVPRAQSLRIDCKSTYDRC